MNPEQRQTLFCLASLLRYPDAELLDTVLSLHSDDLVASGALPPSIKGFMNYVDCRNMPDLQSRYVGTFDNDSHASLYLTGHVYGNSPLQGRALTALHAIYRDSGFSPLPGELPDYLPLMLEFLSVGPEWACASLSRIFAPAVEKVSRHLHARDNPYAPLLNSAGDVLLAHMQKQKEKKVA